MLPDKLKTMSAEQLHQIGFETHLALREDLITRLAQKIPDSDLLTPQLALAMRTLAQIHLALYQEEQTGHQLHLDVPQSVKQFFEWRIRYPLDDSNYAIGNPSSDCYRLRQIDPDKRKKLFSISASRVDQLNQFTNHWHFIIHTAPAVWIDLGDIHTDARLSHVIASYIGPYPTEIFAGSRDILGTSYGPPTRADTKGYFADKTPQIAISDSGSISISL